jgi:hypothetical protein
MDPTQISVAIIMVGVAVGSIVWIHSSMAADSAKRTMGMMRRIGLDSFMRSIKWPAIFGDAQTMTIGKEVRRRCRRCPREDLCERWLAGKVKGGNTFCPNAETFRILAGASAPTLTVPTN